MAANPQPAPGARKRVLPSRLIDLTDQTFGQLLVVQRVDCLHNEKLLGKMEELDLLRRLRDKDWRSIQPVGSDGPHWLCLCDCGKFTVVVGNALRSGNTRSCGCLPAKNRRPDLTGKTFGDRIVMGFVGKGRWECRCTKCGEVKPLLSYKLTAGKASNCSHCSPGRVARGQALQAERRAAANWRPDNWDNPPCSPAMAELWRSIGSVLLSHKSISNEDLGERLDAAGIKCPYGPTELEDTLWENALSSDIDRRQKGAINLLTDIRKWVKKPGKNPAMKIGQSKQ